MTLRAFHLLLSSRADADAVTLADLPAFLTKCETAGY